MGSTQTRKESYEEERNHWLTGYRGMTVDGLIRHCLRWNEYGNFEFLREMFPSGKVE